MFQPPTPRPAGEAAAAIEAALEAIYAELPRIDCQKHCAASCGPVVMSAGEWLRVTSRAGERRAEADLVCPYLERDSGLCGVYEVRPLICRLWGALEGLTCTWGCVPDRTLSQDEAAKLTERVMELSHGRVRSVWAGWEPWLRRLGAVE